MEKETRSLYVQKTGVKLCGCNKHTYLYCNRSGTYKPKGEGKRSMKTQGTCKIGEVCTSYMKVCEHIESGNVSVEFCSNHSGHE